MLLTLGAAGATLLVVLTVLGVPALNACNGDERGLVQCLRGMVDDKFDLGLDPEPAVVRPEARPAARPIVAEAPAPAEVDIAEAPMVKPADEPSRSLLPQVAERPAVPAPKVVAAPPVAAPSEPELSVAEEPVLDEPAALAETIALATVIEPAPSFVPPSPAIDIDGVPPDLLVASVETDAAPAAEPTPSLAEAPSFVPPAAIMAIDGVPPDLLVAAIEPDPAVVASASEVAEAPSFVPPAPTIAIDGLPADLMVAVTEPYRAPAPDFVLPTVPELPASPPPDLVVAAIDPVTPANPEPPATPLLAPSIDAVEIDGDGNFIAGNGPAGATMRLYVDGIPVGVSPVEGGRWLVEGTDLLTEEQQTLKVEALDPLTGKVLGEATIVFEGPVGSVAEPVAEPPAIEPEIAVEQSPAATDIPETVLDQPPMPAPAEAAIEPEPVPVPQIEPVVPSHESPSVIILKPAGDPAIVTLPTGNPSDDAVVTLGATPSAPAIVAQFTLPAAAAAPDVTVLRAIPIGDPGAGRFVSGKAIIRRGDTLWDIAHRYYGHGVHYRTIFRANRALIARPGKIYPGQVFDLPLVYDD